MKYVSLDLETSRVDPKTPDGILMVSLVVEDSNANPLPHINDLPHLTLLVDQGPNLAGSRFALTMNGWILAALELNQGYISRGQDGRDNVLKRLEQCGVPDAVSYRALAALSNYNVVSGIGEMIKNINGFLDIHFPNPDGKRPVGKIPIAGKNVKGFDLPFLPEEISRRFAHRVIDPGPMFIDWEKDFVPPSSEEVMERAGCYISEGMAHDALYDARAVIAALRTTYKKN